MSNQYGSDTKCKMVWVTTSSTSSGSGQEEALKVYPNPTTGEIRWEGMEQEEVTLRVYDALGKLQMEMAATESRMDVMHLPGGLYYLLLHRSNGTMLSGKFVIQR